MEFKNYFVGKSVVPFNVECLIITKLIVGILLFLSVVFYMLKTRMVIGCVAVFVWEAESRVRNYILENFCFFESNYFFVKFSHYFCNEPVISWLGVI